MADADLPVNDPYDVHQFADVFDDSIKDDVDPFYLRRVTDEQGNLRADNSGETKSPETVLGQARASLNISVNDDRRASNSDENLPAGRHEASNESHDRGKQDAGDRTDISLKLDDSESDSLFQSFGMGSNSSLDNLLGSADTTLPNINATQSQATLSNWGSPTAQFWGCNIDNLQLDQTTPLIMWINAEKCRSGQDHEASVLRRLSVAYGIGKLIQSANASQDLCFPSNFIVREQDSCNDINYGNCDAGWEVLGIDMIQPRTSVQLVSTELPKPQGCRRTGRDVSAIIVEMCPRELQRGVNARNEVFSCCSFGELLHFLFSGEQGKYGGHKDDDADTKNQDIADTGVVEPVKKQSRSTSLSQVSICSGSSSTRSSIGQTKDRVSQRFTPLIDYDCPPSISQLVGDLISSCDGQLRSDNAFGSLKDAMDEIRLLFKEPSLLFERTPQDKHLFTLGDRLFGRSVETKQILDAYHRVASTGRSEVVIIGGGFGRVIFAHFMQTPFRSGKTRLVQEAVESDMYRNVYYIERKFEEISTQSCMKLVLSAFDEMLLQIARSESNHQLSSIYWKLNEEFGYSFQYLHLILPNILLLNPSGILFLDDLQWADPTALGLVHAVLSGIEDSKSFLLVGSYRTSDAQNGQLISDFLGLLTRLTAPLTMINLEGIPEAEVNFMISDLLKLTPRLTGALSSLIYRKTEGYPLLVQEFLRNLVDQELVTYSLREKRWFWDVDSEMNILY
eukprot:scaffold41388_cov125-Cyclotella_meneghiniana.AAC.7